MKLILVMPESLAKYCNSIMADVKIANLHEDVVAAAKEALKAYLSAAIESIVNAETDQDDALINSCDVIGETVESYFENHTNAQLSEMLDNKTFNSDESSDQSQYSVFLTELNNVLIEVNENVEYYVDSLTWAFAKLFISVFSGVGEEFTLETAKKILYVLGITSIAIDQDKFLSDGRSLLVESD